MDRFLKGKGQGAKGKGQRAKGNKNSIHHPNFAKLRKKGR